MADLVSQVVSETLLVGVTNSLSSQVVSETLLVGVTNAVASQVVLEVLCDSPVPFVGGGAAFLLMFPRG